MVSDETRKLLALFTDNELEKVFLESVGFESLKQYPSVTNDNKETLKILGHQTDAFHLVEGIEPSVPATSVVWQVEDSPQYLYTYFNSSVPVHRESISDYSWRLHNTFKSPEEVYDDNGTPLDGIELISGWAELEWTKESNGTSTMTVGGKPSNGSFTVDNWPHVIDGDNLIPLVYYAEVITENLTVFLGTPEKFKKLTTLADWEPNSLNAVFVNEVIPTHVRMQPLDGISLEKVLIIDTKHQTNSTLPKYPFWIQGEEIPEGMEFVAEIVAGVAEIDEIMFGDMGIAYIFMSKNKADEKACIFYQSF